MKNNKEDAAQHELSWTYSNIRVSLAGLQSKVLWKPRKAKTKWDRVAASSRT